jgi:hypothetical protein
MNAGGGKTPCQKEGNGVSKSLKKQFHDENVRRKGERGPNQFGLKMGVYSWFVTSAEMVWR